MKVGVTQTIKWLCVFVVALISLECGSAEYTAGKLYIQNQEWEKASESFRKEISNNPRNGDAWFYLGVSSKNLGQDDSAIGQFRQAARIDSTLEQVVEQELSEIPAASNLTDQHDFRGEFRFAIEDSNYIAADRVRLAWLDHLTRIEQRDEECLLSLVGLVDSRAIQLRLGIFSSLKSGKYDEALALRARLKELTKSVYGSSNADAQADYLLLHRLSEAERADLKYVHMFVED